MSQTHCTRGALLTARRALAAGALATALLQAPLAYAQTADVYSAARIDGRTEVEKAIGRCAMAVAGGALLGALLGGKQNAGRGALIGAGAGAGLCVIFISVGSRRDKERLRQLQLQAMNSGQQQSDTWQTTDGKPANATVSATNVIEVTSHTSGEVVKCRRASTRLDVGGQVTDSSDVVCLHGDSWVTLDKLKSLGVNSGDVTV